MTELTKKTRGAKKAMVTPSSRDSISGWLDVLTSMLALPESQRVQVRDELEDHLRSRVDDLLITGTAEPEAVRIAVSELGETAELAQLISHAHSRANPRRRIMNIALITAVVAGLSIGGISWNGGSGAAGTLASGSGGAVAVTEQSPGIGDQTYTFDLEGVTDIQAAEAVAEAFGLEITVSDGLNDFYRKRGFPVMFTLKGELTLDQATKRLEWAGVKSLSNRVVRYSERELFLMTGDEYERQRIEMQIYPSPVWLSKSAERVEFAISLTNLLKVKHDLKYASIEVIDEAIVVAATPEIHEEVVRFSAELNAMIEQRNEERRVLNIERGERRKVEREQDMIEANQRDAQRAKVFEQTVNELQSEFDQARKALLNSKNKSRLIEIEYTKLRDGYSADLPDAQAIADQIMGLEGAIDEITLESEENQERYDYLRKRLLGSQYAQLFAGLK